MTENVFITSLIMEPRAEPLPPHKPNFPCSEKTKFVGVYFVGYHRWFFERHHCDKSHRENYVGVPNVYRVHVKVVARSPTLSGRNGSTTEIFLSLRDARWNRLRSLRRTRREFLLQRRKSFRLHNKRVLRNRKRSNRVRVLAYRCARVMLLISTGRGWGRGQRVTIIQIIRLSIKQ